MTHTARKISMRSRSSNGPPVDPFRTLLDPFGPFGPFCFFTEDRSFSHLRRNQPLLFRTKEKVREADRTLYSACFLCLRAHPLLLRLVESRCFFFFFSTSSCARFLATIFPPLLSFLRRFISFSRLLLFLALLLSHPFLAFSRLYH